jgi:CheY-like chemotaxis protein
MGLERALVVDDSKLARLTLTRMLEKRGIHVDGAASGEEAIGFLESVRPDVIFMDFMMPDMDGYTVAESILTNPRTWDIAVVMCTVQDTPEDRAKARQRGIRGFLTKPASEEALEGVLSALGPVPSAYSAHRKKPAPTEGPIDSNAIEALRASLQEEARTTALDTAWRTTAELADDVVGQIGGRIHSEVLAAAEEAAERVAREVAQSTASSLVQHLASEVSRESAQRSARGVAQTRAAAAKVVRAAADQLRDHVERTVVRRLGTRVSTDLLERTARGLRAHAEEVAARSADRERIRAESVAARNARELDQQVVHELMRHIASQARSARSGFLIAIGLIILDLGFTAIFALL